MEHSAEEMEAALAEIIETSVLAEEPEGENLFKVSTFEAEGYLTTDRGLRVVFENGAVYELTIVQRAAPDRRFPQLAL
jgi:phosphoglucomutase